MSSREASLGRRLAALVYETLLFAALVLVVGFLTVPFSASAPGRAALTVPDLPARVVAFALVFAAGALYFGWCWTGRRRTLAMKTWRIAVVRANGGPLTPKIALIRYCTAWAGPLASLGIYFALRPAGIGALAFPLFAFNFLWALVDRDRQFLHDRIAGTRIVDQGA